MCSGFEDMQHNGQGSRSSSFFGLGEAKSIKFGHPFGRGQKDLPSIFTFGNKDAIEADIIHDDTVREALDGKRDQLFVVFPLDLEPDRNALAMGNCDFQRRVDNRALNEICGVLVIRFERYKNLGRVPELNIA